MRTLLKPLLIASLALPFAACGDDDGGSSDTAKTFAKGDPVVVVGDEYSFDPGAVTVEGGGGPTKIELKNDGSLAHNLRLIKDGDDVGGTPTFQGGETKSGDVTLEPGDYEMICTVGNHADQGMKGTLTVK
jgi:plastocyanin